MRRSPPRRAIRPPTSRRWTARGRWLSGSARTWSCCRVLRSSIFVRQRSKLADWRSVAAARGAGADRGVVADVLAVGDPWDKATPHRSRRRLVAGCVGLDERPAFFAGSNRFYCLEQLFERLHHEENILQSVNLERL